MSFRAVTNMASLDGVCTFRYPGVFWSGYASSAVVEAIEYFVSSLNLSLPPVLTTSTHSSGNISNLFGR